MTQKIGVVTGGRDCPGLNAVIRAVAKAAHRRDLQDMGIVGGYEGLTKVVELIAEQRFGEMVSFSGSQITSVPLSEATGKLRTAPLDGGFVTSARALGICLGD